MMFHICLLQIFSNLDKSKRCFGNLFFFYTSYKIAAILKNWLINNGIMILWSAPFLPIKVCEVFIGVIVIHPSSVHSDLITAYEKWLMAIMSVSPLSGNHVNSPPWNSDSPFIPLHCLFSTSYTLLLSNFHVTNPPFLSATSSDIS